MNTSNNQVNSFLKKDNAISNHSLIDGKQYTIPEIEQKIEDLENEVFEVKTGIKDKENDLNRLKTILREDLLMHQFYNFINQQNEIVQKAVYLNKGLLHFVVRSYFDDIYRYKDYSGTKLANHHKQAAYTIKWIVRFKPIQIREEFENGESLNNIIIDINLIFALVCGFSYLDAKCIDLIIKEKKEIDKNGSGNVGQSFYDKLLYTLRYRPFTGKQLISIFEALELNATFSCAPTLDNLQST